MGGTIELTQGLARDVLRQARDAAGAAFDPLTNPSPFLATDTLAGKVWPGGSLPVEVTPTLAWADPALATFWLGFTALQAAALGPGDHHYLATVTRGGGDPGRIDRGVIRVAAGPGAEAATLAFTTRDDLLEYAPWLEDLQAESDLLTFGREQARATNRLVDALVMTWSPASMAPVMGHPGWNATTLFGASGPPPSWWLRQQLVPLAPGSTPPASMPDRRAASPNFVRPAVSTALLLYDEVAEVCAKWAVGYVCDAQVGRESGRDWWALARRFRADANGLFRSRRYEVDLAVPQTGWASVTIHGGASSLR